MISYGLEECASTMMPSTVVLSVASIPAKYLAVVPHGELAEIHQVGERHVADVQVAPAYLSGN